MLAYPVAFGVVLFNVIVGLPGGDGDGFAPGRGFTKLGHTSPLRKELGGVAHVGRNPSGAIFVLLKTVKVVRRSKAVPRKRRIKRETRG